MLRGHESLGGKCCFAANSFYCLRLPIHPMLKEGDLNAKLGAVTVLEVKAGVRLFSGGRSYLTLRL